MQTKNISRVPRQALLQLLIAIVLVAAVFVAGQVSLPTVDTNQAKAAGGTSITGWAWSDTIGWLSLNCLTGSSSGGTICSTSNYGLTLNTDNTITGYAWSDNIGWVQFGGLSGFPTGSGTQAVNAQVSGGINVIGWARAVANGGGWDGWIYLGSTSHGDGVTYASNALTGYAWGNDVVGWLSFNAIASPPCVETVPQATESNSSSGYYCTSSNTVSNYRDQWCTVTVQTPNPCANGCSAATGQCIAGSLPASGYLSFSSTANVDTARIQKGTTTKLYWTIAHATSCTVRSDATGSTVLSSLTTNPVGGFTTSPITSKTIFTLTCIGEDSSTFSDTATVNMVPLFQEI